MTPVLIAAWAVCLTHRSQSYSTISGGNNLIFNTTASSGEPAKPRDPKDEPTYYSFEDEFTGCTRIQDTRNAELLRAKLNRDTADARKITEALESLACKP